MKLDKREFIRYMTAIVEQHKRDDSIAHSINLIVPDCHITFDSGPAVAALTDIVECLMEDTIGWISYWLWDLEQGTKWKKGMVKIDNRGVRLKTVDDLYRILQREVLTAYENPTKSK